MLGPEERGQLAFLHAAHEQIRLFVAFKHPGDDRAGDLAGELGAQGPVALRAAHGIPPEKLAEEVAGIGKARGLTDAGQDVLFDDLADHVVARDVEAVAECHVRLDAGGGGLIPGDGEGGDAQIDGSAADVHVGDAQGGRVRAAFAAHEREEVAGVALKLFGDLVVEVDELGAGGLIPAATDLRADPVVRAGVPHPLFGRIPLPPSEGFPDHAHCPRHPAAVDPLFGDGHGARHGEDDPLEAAGHVGLFALAALGRGVDGGERVHDDLAEEEHHGRAAGEMGLERHFGLLGAQDFGARGEARIVEAAQRRAFAVDLLDEHAPGDGRLQLGACAPRVEAPLLGAGGLVPQVAFGAGHAGIAFRTHGMLGEPGGFGADAHHRGPDKGRGAAARAGAQARIAEGGFRELDARGEGAGIGAIRLAQIPDLEQVAVVQVGLALGEGFHEHPGGAGVAEIEHEIHVHGRQVGGVHHAHGGDGSACGERLKERQVRGEVLHDERRILAPCGPPVVARGLVGIVDFGDPFVDPQRIEEPRVVAAFGRKGETGVLRHVVVAQGEILARGLFAFLNGRIEQEGQAVSAIGILAADVQAGPVARPLFAFERAVLPLLVGEPQEGHGNPAPRERFKSPVRVDLVVVVAGLPGIVQRHGDKLHLPAGRGDGRFPGLRDFTEIRPEPAEALRVEAAIQKLRAAARYDAHC